MRLTTLLSIVVIIGVPLWGFLWLKRLVEDMMFVPKPRDRVTMAKALAERFGSKVTLLELPVINRDVNGYAGIVKTTVPPGRYSSKDHTFAFERIEGRDVCLMAHRPWELELTRATYRHRSH